MQQGGFRENEWAALDLLDALDADPMGLAGMGFALFDGSGTLGTLSRGAQNAAQNHHGVLVWRNNARDGNCDWHSFVVSISHSPCHYTGDDDASGIEASEDDVIGFFLDTGIVSLLLKNEGSILKGQFMPVLISQNNRFEKPSLYTKIEMVSTGILSNYLWQPRQVGAIAFSPGRGEVIERRMQGNSQMMESDKIKSCTWLLYSF